MLRRVGIGLFSLLAFAAPLKAAETAPCASYRFERLLDEGRAYEGGSRPIDFGLWLPSACRGARVSWRDLARDSAIQSGETEAQILGAVQPDQAAMVDRPVGVSVRAGAGARRPRPLVLYIHPNVIGAAPIAERLAREGFAVASMTWRGSFAQPFDVAASGMVSEMLDAQALTRELIRRGVAENGRIYVIGMSFGALTALCLAQADPRVAALVSHDGGLSTPTAPRLSPLCPWFAADRPRARALFLYDASYARTDWTFVEQFRAMPRQLVPVPLLEHGDYVGTVLLRALIDPAMTEREARVRHFQAMAGATVDFLRCVRDRPSAPCAVSLEAARSG